MSSLICLSGHFERLGGQSNYFSDPLLASPLTTSKLSGVGGLCAQTSVNQAPTFNNCCNFVIWGLGLRLLGGSRIWIQSQDPILTLYLIRKGNACYHGNLVLRFLFNFPELSGFRVVGRISYLSPHRSEIDRNSDTGPLLQYSRGNVPVTPEN